MDHLLRYELIQQTGYSVDLILHIHVLYDLVCSHYCLFTSVSLLLVIREELLLFEAVVA